MNIINDPDYIKKNISIVIQGPVIQSNISNIANHCFHWRQILPEAEIILSISTTDCLIFNNINNENHLIKSINNVFIVDFTLSNPINIIKKTCNIIIFDEFSLVNSLPPIKDDTTESNNINFLIKSSQDGLSVVSNPYVLRIRNDAVFLNTNFIDLYCKNYAYPRKEASLVFKQRVLVSWIYTLNPYSEERFPLHISDWLNFGLTEDVKKIWDIPFYTFKDAVYYEEYKRDDVNFYERKFNLRLAVEQYIYSTVFKKLGKKFHLDYINDKRSVDYCMDLLVDNFYISGNKFLSLRINKDYQKELANPYKRSLCISEDAWRFMLLNREISYKDILKGNVDNNIKKLSKNTFLLEKNLPNKSPLHYGNGKFRKIIFSFYSIILSDKMKSKFIFSPDKFFNDSRSLITKKIGYYYLKNKVK